MITDKETNFVYFADSLKLKHEKFFIELTAILNRNNINWRILNNTKDIWCRDYMPIQVSENELVQFRFEPSYYNDDLEHLTNPAEVCNASEIYPAKFSDIKLDGGNVVKSKNKVIISDKIYEENIIKTAPEMSLLVSKIRDLLEVEEVILIPHQPEDTSGHADGMVRFIDDRRVIINEPVDGIKPFQDKLKANLEKHKLEVIEMPYELCDEISDEIDDYTAKGYYINYLHIGNLIVLPSFGFKKDQSAKEKISSLFPGNKIETIDCNEIAYKGGVLNCISWNIKNN